MTIGERLNQTHPAFCDICGTPLDRTRSRWSICPTCRHDNTGPEAYLIGRIRAEKATLHGSQARTRPDPYPTTPHGERTDNGAGATGSKFGGVPKKDFT